MRRQGKGCTGFPKNIILTGFMGCGKTTVGRLLAAALHLPFADADHEIEKAAGMEIPAIFQACGEPYFRRLEEEQIEKLLCDAKFVEALVADSTPTTKQITNFTSATSQPPDCVLATSQLPDCAPVASQPANCTSATSQPADSVQSHTGGIVLATGGGAVMSERNRQNFHEKGISIYLQLHLSECIKRISQDASRPLGSGKSREELAALFASRRAFYEDCDICYITDGKTPQQCAQELSVLLRPMIK